MKENPGIGWLTVYWKPVTWYLLYYSSRAEFKIMSNMSSFFSNDREISDISLTVSDLLSRVGWGVQ